MLPKDKKKYKRVQQIRGSSGTLLRFLGDDGVAPVQDIEIQHAARLHHSCTQLSEKHTVLLSTRH